MVAILKSKKSPYIFKLFLARNKDQEKFTTEIPKNRILDKQHVV